MHDPFEAYLAEVSEALRPLPPARRNEELREMRQHLADTMTIKKASGLSVVEAAFSAIDQFGNPQALGEHVVQAWRRGKLLEWRNFLGAAAFALLGQSSLIRLELTRVIDWPIQLLHILGWHSQDFFQWERVAMQCIFCVFVGLAAVVLFPRKVLAGMITGTLVWYGIFFVLMGMGENWQTTHLVNYQIWLSEYAAYGLCVVLAAWVGCRLRTRKQSQHKALFS